MGEFEDRIARIKASQGSATPVDWNRRAARKARQTTGKRGRPRKGLALYSDAEIEAEAKRRGLRIIPLTVPFLPDPVESRPIDRPEI